MRIVSSVNLSSISVQHKKDSSIENSSLMNSLKANSSSLTVGPESLSVQKSTRIISFQKMRKTNVYSTYKDYFLHCYFTSSKKKIVATLNILFMVWSLPNSMCCLLPTKHILKKENDVFLRFRNVIKDRFSVAALLLCVFFSIPY